MMKLQQIMICTLFLPALCSAEYYSSDYDTRIRELQEDQERQEREYKMKEEHKCFVENDAQSCSFLAIASFCYINNRKECEIAKKAIHYGCEYLHSHTVCYQGMSFYAGGRDVKYADPNDILYERDADPRLVLHYANLACQYKSKNDDWPGNLMDYCSFAQRLEYSMTRK